MASSRRQYPFHLIEPKWQQFWEIQQTFRAFNPGRGNSGKPSVSPATQTFRQTGRHAIAAEILHPRHVSLSERRGLARRPSGRLHRHGHSGALQTRAAVSTCCIRWAGTPSACPPSNTPSRPASIRARPPSRTSPPSSGRFNRLGFSYDWSRELATTDPDYFKWTQWIFLKLYNSWFNPETNKAEPIETLKYPAELESRIVQRASRQQNSKSRLVSKLLTALGIRRRAYRDSKRLAYVSEAAGLVVRTTRHRAGQRRSRGRQKRSRRLSRRPQADAPMDAPHHRLRRETAGRPRHD